MAGVQQVFATVATPLLVNATISTPPAISATVSGGAPVAATTTTSPQASATIVTGAIAAVVSLSPTLTVTLGVQGPPGATGASASQTILGVAAVPLSGHMAVIKQADGTLTYADATTLADVDALVLITTSAIAASSTGSVLAFGEVTEPSWSWIVGLPVFLGPNGSLIQTPPSFPSSAFSMNLARVESPTTIFWNPESGTQLV